MKAMVPVSLTGFNSLIAGVIEGLAVGAVRQHHVVQADAAGREALRLGVVDAVDQPHELRHDVHVIPGRPEGVFRHRQRSGKITKSMFAVPAVSDGEVSTVKIEGSG